MSRLREFWATLVRAYQARTEREQRLLIGGGIVAGLLLGYFFVIEPLKNLRADLATEIAEKHAQLETEARLVTRGAALRSERDTLRQRLKVEKEKLLPGESAVLAKAALQERLNTLANEKSVTVQSVQDLKEEVVEPFVRVAVRITLSGEIRPIAEMLAGLEYGKTQISVPFIELNRRGAVPGAKGPRPLNATIEASGYILSPGTAEAAAEGEGAPAEGGAPGPGEAAARGEGNAGEGDGGVPNGELDGEAPPPEGAPPAAAPPATAPPDAAPALPEPGRRPDSGLDATAPPPVPPVPAPSPAPAAPEAP